MKAVNVNDVLKILHKYGTFILVTDSKKHSDMENEIANLPSVTPKQKTGKWIVQDIHNCHTDFRCSECGYIHKVMILYGKPTADYTYCPNCGAKMKGESYETQAKEN